MTCAEIAFSLTDVTDYIPGLTLIATLVLIIMGVPPLLTKQPSFRLARVEVDPWSSIDGTWRTDTNPKPVHLVFTNDGPGLAPDLIALVDGFSGTTLRFPKSGNPTLQVGDEISVEWTFSPVTPSEDWPQRNFSEGDDWRFDFSNVRVQFEWGRGRHRKRRKFRNLDYAQRAVPVVVLPVPDDTIFKED